MTMRRFKFLLSICFLLPALAGIFRLSPLPVVSGQSGGLDAPSAPAGNPVTATKAALGKTLFWDEQLSSTRTVACGTCHVASNGGADPRSASPGARSTNPGPDGVFGTADDIQGSVGVPLALADGSYKWSA